MTAATVVRRIVRTMALLAVVLAVLVAATTRGADPALYPPPADAPAVTLAVVDHGYHAGLVAPTAALIAAAERDGRRGAAAIAARFGAYPFVEIGWGDERFYRDVPTLSALTLHEAARALFLPGNPSVLHVVGLDLSAAQSFPRSGVVELRLSQAGFARLVGELDATIRRAADGEPMEAGRGVYGPSMFFAAEGHFNLFNVCNHWVSRLLSAAGAPTAPVVATISALLLADLRWRAGAVDPRSPLPLTRM